MIALSFIQNEDGQYEASFLAGQVNVLQLVTDLSPLQCSSLSVMARVSDDMPYQAVKVYVPCPSTIINLPVQQGMSVKLVTDVPVSKAYCINTSVAGGVDTADITALAELIEQNRQAIEEQKRVNEEQQTQINKNTEVNEQQEERIIEGTDIAPAESITNLFK